MGAFLGFDDVGVWASNMERDLFLEWFAEHRCTKGDPGWEYCKSDSHRWTGCCIELSEIVPAGSLLAISSDERSAAAQISSEFAMLLDIVAAITRGEWKHTVGSRGAVDWRPVES